MLTLVAPLPRSSDIEWCKGVELGMELVKLDKLGQGHSRKRDGSSVLDLVVVEGEEMGGRLLSGLAAT